ncbi:hypothetical protein U8C43_33705 (plasmid) [Sinorhizobium meliloti]|nr:hypothetical protein U8C30_33745 [Sinorhizobium meliloti]WQP29230.1 hypothetical protein U8C43_33705 [Sinorhizobium meliloti]
MSRDFDRLVRKVEKRSPPIWVVKALRRLCRAPVSSTVMNGADTSPACSTALSSSTNGSRPVVSSRTTCRFEISTPMPLRIAVRRGVVTCPWVCSARQARRRLRPKPLETPSGNGATITLPSGVSQHGTVRNSVRWAGFIS